MKTPIEVWISVGALGGRLGISDEKLRVLLPEDSPPEFENMIRQHKAALLDLYRLKFHVIQSDILKATVFWAADEQTAKSLAAYGADRGSIYTPTEIELLINNRVTAGQLKTFHEAKKGFSGKLAKP
jgi:hypothetical protein